MSSEHYYLAGLEHFLLSSSWSLANYSSLYPRIATLLTRLVLSHRALVTPVRR